MQVLVVGAGVVGLAVARAAALAGHDVTVAEVTGGIANGVSSRNSEVIHAGLYYPTDTLRAKLCVRGRRMLYDFCASHGVGHRKCGKLVVATNDAELAKVETIMAQAQNERRRRRRDDRRQRGARHGSGIVLHRRAVVAGNRHHRQPRFHAGAVGRLEDRGGMIAFETPVERMTYKAPHWHVQFGGRDPGVMPFDAVVNAAGLGAQALARRIENYPAGKVPRLVLGKGNYFGFAGRPAFSRLIYPTPIDGGLGVHVTLDLAGRMRFGPDVEWITEENYAVDPRRADSFYARIRTYWPGLPDGSLVPDYCGIRPKLSGQGEPQADFMIAGPPAHGMPRLVNLFGIESPGLTSSLALAEEVVAYLKD